MKIDEILKPKNMVLSKSDEKIYKVFKQSPSHIQLMTIQKVAAAADVSIASVQRYCKKLGFDGFKEFKYHFKDYVVQKNKNDESGFLKKYISVVNQFENIDKNIIDKFAEDLITADVVYTMGIFYSSLPAKQLTMGMIDLEEKSFTTNDYVTASHWNNLLNKDDIFVFFSVSGEEIQFKHYLANSVNKTKNSYLITFNPNSQLASYFENVIVLPGRSLVYDLTIDPQSLACLFVEMVIERIASKKR
ncbi:MAG: MurR/RpiR family transcriptional regulator [Lactobacillus sp.]